VYHLVSKSSYRLLKGKDADLPWELVIEVYLYPLLRSMSAGESAEAGLLRGKLRVADRQTFRLEKKRRRNDGPVSESSRGNCDRHGAEHFDGVCRVESLELCVAGSGTGGRECRHGIELAQGSLLNSRGTSYAQILCTNHLKTVVGTSSGAVDNRIDQAGVIPATMS